MTRARESVARARERLARLRTPCNDGPSRRRAKIDRGLSEKRPSWAHPSRKDADAGAIYALGVGAAGRPPSGCPSTDSASKSDRAVSSSFPRWARTLVHSLRAAASYAPRRGIAAPAAREEVTVEDTTAEGTVRIIEGRRRVYYLGYWVRAYDVPADSLHAKKRLIEALTRRLFNHVEHGINIPGRRLDEARHAYDAEGHPARKRVKAAMLAGALFNRAADIFTKVVEIQALGVHIGPENVLMRECGEHLMEALTLGKLVRHRSGEEGLDELWGEPFRAFSFPIEEFYRGRYIKIAQTMQSIDEICQALLATLGPRPMFDGIETLLHDFARDAKTRCETLHTDEDIFEVWTSFVVSAERLAGFAPTLPEGASAHRREDAARGMQLLRDGMNVVTHVTRARVPMPKTTAAFIDTCRQYRSAAHAQAPRGARAHV
jgi:hypothetical protein